MVQKQTLSVADMNTPYALHMRCQRQLLDIRWCMGSCLQCRGAPWIWLVNHWWHLTSSSISGHDARLDPGVSCRLHDTSDGGYTRRQKGNGQLEKTTGPSSQRLARQRPGGCQRYAAVYTLWRSEIARGARSGATVHSDYATILT